jgi:hypothetical protein
MRMHELLRPSICSRSNACECVVLGFRFLLLADFPRRTHFHLSIRRSANDDGEEEDAQASAEESKRGGKKMTEAAVNARLRKLNFMTECFLSTHNYLLRVMRFVEKRIVHCSKVNVPLIRHPSLGGSIGLLRASARLRLPSGFSLSLALTFSSALLAFSLALPPLRRSPLACSFA